MAGEQGRQVGVGLKTTQRGEGRQATEHRTEPQPSRRAATIKAQVSAKSHAPQGDVGPL